MDDTTVTEAGQAQLDADAAREELRAKIRSGFQQLDRGEGVEASEEFFQEFKDYLDKKQSA